MVNNRLSEEHKGKDWKKKLTDWIRKHQVAAFFFLAFVITWGLGFSYDEVIVVVKTLMNAFFILILCGACQRTSPPLPKETIRQQYAFQRARPGQEALLLPVTTWTLQHAK
jgi:hypothetical protein